jgi:hypothetical protein
MTPLLISVQVFALLSNQQLEAAARNLGTL